MDKKTNNSMKRIENVLMKNLTCFQNYMYMKHLKKIFVYLLLPVLLKKTIHTIYRKRAAAIRRLPKRGRPTGNGRI